MKHYLALLVDVSFTSPECTAFVAALGAPLSEGSSKLIPLPIKEYYKQNVTMTMQDYNSETNLFSLCRLP